MRLAVVPLLFAWLGPEPVAPPSSALPWLGNFAPVAETSDATANVVARMATWRDPDPSCSASAYGGLALTADVAPPRGPETVLASFTQGVLVLDAKHRLIASAIGSPCRGSADELVAMAAGDAYIGGAVIAIAVTTGGRHESQTWLRLFRVFDGEVAAIFEAVVEEHVGERSRAGEVHLLPGALLYRTPRGERTLWAYDADERRYRARLVVELDAGEPNT